MLASFYFSLVVRGYKPKLKPDRLAITIYQHQPDFLDKHEHLLHESSFTIQLWTYKCTHKFFNVYIIHLPSFISFCSLMRVYQQSRFIGAIIKSFSFFSHNLISILVLMSHIKCNLVAVLITLCLAASFIYI